MHYKLISLALAILITILPPLASAQSTIKLKAPLFNHLGTLHHPISTTQPIVQQFFDQGLVLAYGFEWGEAVRSFQEATRLDPSCAICYWGLAMTLGYTSDGTISGHEYSDARVAIRNALNLAAKSSLEERAYIEALALRYQHSPGKGTNIGPLGFLNFGGENATASEKSHYANAMKKITEDYPLDNDAKALYAYALFDLANWQFWENGKITEHTPELIKTLETVLAKDPMHVAANHYYVHVIEQSPHPEQALPNADRLKTLVPLSEHLVHMPVHIYFLTGRYHEASQSNMDAISAFQTYTKLCQAQGFSPAWNYLYMHNFDFLRATAIMEGRKSLALGAARGLVNSLPTALIESDPKLQWVIPVPYFVMARFGMWNEILIEPMPLAKYTYATGMWHYARGMAYAHLHNITAANNELVKLQEAAAESNQFSWKDIGHKLLMFTINYVSNNPSHTSASCHDNTNKIGYPVLQIATHVLTATIANYQQDEASLLSHLQDAEDIQNELGYHEPPVWYFPTKEILADAYLQWHHPKEAKALYELDLKQYPENGWALYGLAISQHQLGMIPEAKQTEAAFNKAWQYADTPAPYFLFQS